MRGPSVRRISIWSAAVFLSTACSGGDELATTAPSAAAVAIEESAEPSPPPEPSPTPDTPSPEPTTEPPAPVASPPPADTLEQVALTSEPFIDVENLTAMAWRRDDPGLYFATQDGMVHRVVDGEVDQQPVIDLTDEVTPLEPGSERGLLGIAFDPEDGRMFLHYTDRANSHTHIESFEINQDQARMNSRREVLFEEQPGVGHNGGQLAFDEDGHLYVALGDGGGSNGRDAQDMSKILGSIIRITPDRDGPGYDVPDDNPFVDDDDIRSEIWVTGLRNPWRFSIDDDTGDIWLGDVGDNAVEEVNHVPAGESGLNFGWYFFEGTTQHHSDVPDDLVAPVFEYPHSVGPAVIGGYVYRGEAIPELAGAYVFGDLSGIVWAMGADGEVELPVRIEGAVTSFGEGPDDELYVLTLSQGAFRLVAE